MIDYPHTEEGEITPPGVPDDIAFLGTHLDTIASLLKKLVDVNARTARQPVQLLFQFNAAATGSTIRSTTNRVHVDWMVIPTEPVAPLNLLAGNGVFMAGIGASGGPDVVPVSFVIEPGIDYQFVSSGGAPYSRQTHVWLVGTVEAD